jgi:hypothetical protein
MSPGAHPGLSLGTLATSKRQIVQDTDIFIRVFPISLKQPQNGLKTNQTKGVRSNEKPEQDGDDDDRGTLHDTRVILRTVSSVSNCCITDDILSNTVNTTSHSLALTFDYVTVVITGTPLQLHW